MKYLIVNADDFGYSYGINKGIIQAFTEGIVTSTSVMVDGIASGEAEQLTQFKDLSIGLHFAVENFDNLKAELDRQIEKFVSIVGRMPDHIDTHKIYTSRDGFSPVLPDYSKKHSIPLRELSGVKFIDSYFGKNGAVDVTVDKLIVALEQCREGYNELMCHPGLSDDYLRKRSSYSDIREVELRAVCSQKAMQFLYEHPDIQLCGWNQVPLP